MRRPVDRASVDESTHRVPLVGSHGESDHICAVVESHSGTYDGTDSETDQTSVYAMPTELVPTEYRREPESLRSRRPLR